jgi:hypothetical protein
MTFPARPSELREMVRNQYPGMDVGTVDEATAREVEKRTVLEAIEHWCSARNQRLGRLAEIVETLNGNAEHDFVPEAASVRADMHALFADCLRNVPAPTMLGLRIVTGAQLEEEKFCDALEAARPVAAAMDAICAYNAELEAKTNALTAKWRETAQIAAAILRDEAQVLEEIQKVIEEAINVQAERILNRREKFRAWVKAAKDALQAVTLGAAIVGGVPPEVISAGKEVLDKGNEIAEGWGKMSGDLEARKARYQDYFTHDHASLLVMFKDTRQDARDFLDKHDYTRLVLDWTSKARSAIDSLRSSVTTSGQKADTEALAGRFSHALETAESDAKARFDDFVSNNTEHFFGAFSPDLDRALLGTEDWDARYRKIAAIDVPGLLHKWIEDDQRDFREIDLTDLPETWQGELRETATASLEKLAQTEAEMAANNSPDMVRVWVEGQAAKLLDIVR